MAFVGQATSGFFPQSDALTWLFNDPGFGFMTGILFISLGLVLMGVATLRARVLPRWCGFALIALVVFSVLGPFGGFVAFGLTLMALGYALRSPLGTSTGQPSRVA